MANELRALASSSPWGTRLGSCHLLYTQLLTRLGESVSGPEQHLARAYVRENRNSFIRGHAVSLSMVVMSAVIYSGLWWWYARENKRGVAGLGRAKVDGLTESEVMDLGDESPHFKFIP